LVYLSLAFWRWHLLRGEAMTQRPAKYENSEFAIDVVRDGRLSMGIKSHMANDTAAISMSRDYALLACMRGDRVIVSRYDENRAPVNVFGFVVER